MCRKNKYVFKQHHLVSILTTFLYVERSWNVVRMLLFGASIYILQRSHNVAYIITKITNVVKRSLHIY